MQLVTGRIDFDRRGQMQFQNSFVCMTSKNQPTAEHKKKEEEEEEEGEPPTDSVSNVSDRT